MSVETNYDGLDPELQLNWFEESVNPQIHCPNPYSDPAVIRFQDIGQLDSRRDLSFKR
jgi:hypothetical protein